WMGHADRMASLRGINGVRSVTGGSHPAIAWADIMTAAHDGVDVVAFPEPAEIVSIAETADEMVHLRRPEFTEAGDRRAPARLQTNCGGVSCTQRAVPLPTVPPPVVPTLPPADGADPVPATPDTQSPDTQSPDTQAPDTAPTDSQDPDTQNPDTPGPDTSTTGTPTTTEP
ncbi:MAG: hypothetical protein AAGA65_25255, partial [Actinomycetota bacterium]